MMPRDNRPSEPYTREPPTNEESDLADAAAIEQALEREDDIARDIADAIARGEWSEG